MFAHNTVRLTGNVGSDAEVRHFDSGKTKASFSLAVYAGKDRPTEWFDVEAWGAAAERVAEHVHKGVRVVLSGSLKQERWKDKASGGNRSKVVVNAESIDVVASLFSKAKLEDIPF